MTDPSPTPKQSGSYAIALGICEDTYASLEKLRVTAVRSAWEHVGSIEAWQARFGLLAELVKGWDATTDPSEKRETIDRVFSSRAGCEAWVTARGWAL